MIRQTWPRVINAASGLASRNRCIFSSSSSSSSTNTPSSKPSRRQHRPQHANQRPAQAQTPWPLLKRRSNPNTTIDAEHPLPNVNPWTKPLDKRQDDDAAPKSQSNKANSTPTPGRSHLMLTINGLSTNLKATDFARLSSTELSAWQQAIKKVQQQRHPETYEPLGRYTLTFSTAEAAAAYQAKLLRLHALAQHKALSTETPWQNSVPADLLEPDSTHDSLKEQIAQYTIALGTQQPVDIQRSRVTISKPWAAKLSALVEGDGYGEHPHLVMLDVSPPVVSVEDLFDQICKDAEMRGTRWGVAKPHSLALPPPPPTPTPTPKHPESESAEEISEDDNESDRATQPKRKPPARHNQFIQDVLSGRFIVSCSDEAEARRFHRFWNMRQLQKKTSHNVGQYVVRARIIEW